MIPGLIFISFKSTHFQIRGILNHYFQNLCRTSHCRIEPDKLPGRDYFISFQGSHT